jgi:hypothetical protein
MTPKEKAIELVDKFSLRYYHLPNAKYCALIAVYEVLKVASCYNDTGAENLYWQQVKAEIEKL